MSAAAAKSVSIAEPVRESGSRKRARDAFGTRCGREGAHKGAVTAEGLSVRTRNAHVEDEDEEDDNDSHRTVSPASSARTCYNPASSEKGRPIARPKHRNPATTADAVLADMYAAMVRPDAHGQPECRLE